MLFAFYFLMKLDEVNFVKKIIFNYFKKKKKTNKGSKFIY